MSAEKGIRELEAEIQALMSQGNEEVETTQEEDRLDQSVKVSDSFISKKGKEETENTSLAPEEETWKKRHGDLRRHSQKIERELREELDSLKQKLEEVKSKPSSNPPTNPEEVKAWVEKYPQVAAIIQALAEEQANRLYGDEIKNIKIESARTKKEKDLSRIYKAHDDFDEIKEDDAFHDWVEAQPDFIQDAVYNGNADKVIWALNAYKEAKKPKVNMDKKAAESIGKSSKVEPTTSDGKKRFLESDIEDMTTAEFEKNREEIQEAIREGRFIYDISGAAR